MRLRALIEGYRGVRVRLERWDRPRHWRVLGRSRRLDVGLGKRTVRIAIRNPLRAGRHRVTAIGSDAYGRVAIVRRTTRLRPRL